MIATLIYYIRQFAIFRFLWWIIRNLLPFAVFPCFWPEISDFMSRFPLWNEMIWQLKDFWRDLSAMPVFRDILGFLQDAFGWMIGEIQPTLRAIGSFLQGIFG